VVFSVVLNLFLVSKCCYVRGTTDVHCGLVVLAMKVLISRQSRKKSVISLMVGFSLVMPCITILRLVFMSGLQHLQE